MELKDCCTGGLATTSGFISKYVSESTQNFKGDWFLPTWDGGTCAGMD